MCRRTEVSPPQACDTSKRRVAVAEKQRKTLHVVSPQDVVICVFSRKNFSHRNSNMCMRMFKKNWWPEPQRICDEIHAAAPQPCRVFVGFWPYKLIVNHSHSWLPPRGGPELGPFCPLEFIRLTPCITVAMVVCPACCVMLAAFARVTGACAGFAAPLPEGSMSRIVSSELALGGCTVPAGMVGKVLTDARD